MKKQIWYVFGAVSAAMLIVTGLSFWAVCKAVQAETNVRYAGLQNMIAQKMEKTISIMESKAEYVFDEVGRNLQSPDAVIAALQRKAGMAPDARGYFAAFEPEFFKEKGLWFEPYVHHEDSGEFVLSMVGSARHDYTKSSWYIRAKSSKDGFWSDPYYYYDGTEISGRYCTYIEPVFNQDGKLACVCGADITFDWLIKELMHVDEQYKTNRSLNKFMLTRDLDFFSVIVDKDGSGIVLPTDKKLTIKDKELIQDMMQRKSGSIGMTVDGVESTLYYGPIEGISWTLVVVVPNHDIRKPELIVGLVLLAIAIIGIIVTWFICRQIRYAEES